VTSRSLSGRTGSGAYTAEDGLVRDQDCSSSPTTPQNPPGRGPDYADDYDEDDLADCWNCGGDGFVSSCFEEWACVDPEGGCDLCTRRCDVCRPQKAGGGEDA
jgi:hypothetical protein